MPHPPARPVSTLGGHLVGAALATRPGCRGGDTRRAPVAGGGGDFGVPEGLSVIGRRPLVVAGGTVGHSEGTACNAGDSSLSGGQLAMVPPPQLRPGTAGGRSAAGGAPRRRRRG